MCGIVGYTGKRGAADIIISGLKRLEYRGYDSAGVALYPNAGGELNLIRRPGKIVNLEEAVRETLPISDASYACMGIATEGDKEISTHADDIIWIPKCMEFVSPIPVVIAEQLFAYHIANFRGCEIDQPRNLAKSVTVE